MIPNTIVSSTDITPPIQANMGTALSIKEIIRGATKINNNILTDMGFMSFDFTLFALVTE